MPTKLTLPLQSSGKMEVTPQQSEILQKELFKMGYAWAFIEEPELDHVDKPFIYWENKEIMHSPEQDRDFFSRDELPLHLFDNHFKIEE